MSKPEDRTEPNVFHKEAYPRLETAVAAVLTQVDGLRSQLRESRGKTAEMEELLRKFTAGEEDPSRLMTRLRGLEAENEILLERLRKGREGVDRLLARIRFLEEQG